MMEIKKSNEWVEIKEKSELKGINGGYRIIKIIKQIMDKQSGV